MDKEGGMALRGFGQGLNMIKLHHTKLKELMEMRGKGDQGRHPLLTSGLSCWHAFTYTHVYTHIYTAHTICLQAGLYKTASGITACLVCRNHLD